MSAQRSTYVTSKSTGRTYWVHESGLAEEIIEDEPDYENERRAEFLMSWVCGGGAASDANAAWSMYRDRWDGCMIRDDYDVRGVEEVAQ